MTTNKKEVVKKSKLLYNVVKILILIIWTQVT